MADTRQVRKSGKRLAGDLKAIREARNIEQEQVLEAIRLPKDVVNRFEEDALVSHPAYNRVYLLSIAGSYARVLGLPVEEVQSALKDTLAGTYAGSLRRSFLDEAEGEIDEEDSDAVEIATPESTTEHVEDVASSESEHEETSAGGVRLSGTVEHSGKASKSEIDSFRTRLADVQRGLLLPNLKGFLPTLIILTILILFVWYLLSGNGDSSTDSEPVAAISQDSLLVEEIIPRYTLPDTMFFDVVAAQERLDPIRVTVDDLMRRPYWVEYLDTLRFAATDSILFEREAAVASIVLLGYVVPDSMLDDSGKLNITRDRVQNWLDAEIAASRDR
jgi:transcriptional regulator with XRE-family HTH domain